MPELHGGTGTWIEDVHRACTGELLELNVLDHGYVNEVEHWGSDERIIESARMSTDGSFRGWDVDTKLLHYLWDHKHHSPFEMGGLTIEVQSPIFVAREWMRHRTQSYNELSGRYTELPDLFYIPSIERLMGGKQGVKNKQGSEEGFSEIDAKWFQQFLQDTTDFTRQAYVDLLGWGVARELARLVVPVNQYTRFRASANLRNWLAFLSLRLDRTAQWEIRQYAQEVAKIIQEHFPRTYALFDKSSGGGVLSPDAEKDH